jgi:tRNA(fMet)-specific endonuclease VapC
VTRTLLDTDILSEVQRQRDPIVVRRATAYYALYGRYTIAIVTVIEVVMGHHQAGRPRLAEQFVQALPALEVLHLDIESAVLAGRMMAGLRRAGRPIGWADPLIAAIALHHGLTLVTGNTAHYAHIQALGYPLRLDNWREP